MPGFEIEIGKQLREVKANIKDRDQRFLIIINLKFEFTSIKPTLNCIFITDRNKKKCVNNTRQALQNRNHISASYFSSY